MSSLTMSKDQEKEQKKIDKEVNRAKFRPMRSLKLLERKAFNEDEQEQQLKKTVQRGITGYHIVDLALDKVLTPVALIYLAYQVVKLDATPVSLNIYNYSNWNHTLNTVWFIPAVVALAANLIGNYHGYKSRKLEKRLDNYNSGIPTYTPKRKTEAKASAKAEKSSTKAPPVPLRKWSTPERAQSAPAKKVPEYDED